MKQVGKVKTILRAFTQESDIDPDILAHRRVICEKCEFNSNNLSSDELNLFSRVRKQAFKKHAFCTVCSCQIKEKTSQETEECGLVEKGLPPKWNRVKLETVDVAEVNIINKTPEKVNIKLEASGECFILDFGKFLKKDLKKVEILVQSKEGSTLIMNYMTPSCNSCTTLLYNYVDKNTISVLIELKTYLLGDNISKKIYFGYEIDGNYKKNMIKLIGALKR